MQKADKGSDQAHEHKQARQIHNHRFFVADALFDCVNKRIHGLDGDLDFLCSGKLPGHELISVAEQARPLKNLCRGRAASKLPELIILAPCMLMLDIV